MRTYSRKKLPVQDIEDVQSLCRLCLGKTEKMISIFGGNAHDLFTGLSMRIAMCLGLEVSRDDVFPKRICQLCNSELEKFYTFKKNCAITFRRLKASLLFDKKNDRNKVNNENSQKKTNDLLAVQNRKESNGTVERSPSQSLQQNVISVELVENKSSFRKENRTHENSLILKSEINNTTIIEFDIGEKCDTLTVCDEHNDYTNEIQPTEVTGQDVLVNESQLSAVNHDCNIVKAQEDKGTEKTKNIQSMQCLPAYILASLIEKGAVAKINDSLEIVDQDNRTFHLETSCGSKVIMELVEEDSQVPADDCDNATRSNLRSNARCCGACGLRLSTRNALVRHMRVHSGEKPFPCRDCGRRFAQRGVLRRHQLLHTGKLPFRCARCPKAYTQRGALVAHARSHAPPAARPLVLHRCSRCPKVFLYPSGLSRHLGVHEGRQYACDECARTFADKGSMQRHRRLHQRRAR